MTRTLVLLVVAAGARAGSSVDAYIGQVNHLVAVHRATVARLAAPAQASADALAAGGRFYLNDTDNFAWFYEGIGRAGGLMQTDIFTADSAPRPGDVLWISYTASTYRNAVSVSTRLAPQNVVVVAFGPRPPDEPLPFVNWVDSQAPWAADDDLTLFGNVLSLWTMEGELAAATARQGKTLVFWQGILVPGGPNRNSHYADQLFHDGFPQMQAIDVGILSAAYLDSVARLLGRITQTERTPTAAAARQLAERSAAGNPPVLVVTSHLLPFIGLEKNPLFHYISDPDDLDRALAQSRFLIDIGYSGVDLELWRKVRLADAQAVWITGQLPNQNDFSGHGDIFIDEHWQLGDASVPVPGYDVRLLPVSGVAQLFIYELLVKAAMDQ
ncbi:MAG TPA: hypothetical protein VGH38_27745 [Bryobacteraceae bacterium]